jgi:hypothetical protein
VFLQEFAYQMMKDATSSENVLQDNQGAPTMCDLPPKVARTNVLEWRTPEDRDEKAGNSCIKIPQLGRGDNDVQSPQLKRPMIQSAKDGPWSNLGRPRAQNGPGRLARSDRPNPFWRQFGPPFFGVK